MLYNICPVEKSQDVEVPEHTDSPTHEFVSDEFRASSRDLEEVREGMKKLGMDPKASGEFLCLFGRAQMNSANLFNYGSNSILKASGAKLLSLLVARVLLVLVARVTNLYYVMNKFEKSTLGYQF